jgi:hypothetical protein
MTKTGAENDRERDPRRRDRNAIDITAAAVRQRVTEPPPLRLQRSESVPHLLLRLRPDTAAGGQPHPLASVDEQADRDQQQRSRDSPHARRRGDDYECARREGRDAARRRAAQAPVLLAAGEARDEHRQRLASRTDKPGRPVGCGARLARRRRAPRRSRSCRRPVKATAFGPLIWSVSLIVRLSIPWSVRASAHRRARFRIPQVQKTTSPTRVGARPCAPGPVPSRSEPSDADRQNTIGREGWVPTARLAHRPGDRTAGDPPRAHRCLRGRRDRCGRRAPRGTGHVNIRSDGRADRCARVGPTPRCGPRLGVRERGSAGRRAPRGRPAGTPALRCRPSPGGTCSAQWGRPATVHRVAATPSRAASTERRYRRDPHPRQVQPMSADGPRSLASTPSLDSQRSWILNDTWRIR